MLNVRELATDKNELKCRSFCIGPIRWRVFIAETKWHDGTQRPLVIFHCPVCDQFRYLDLDGLPTEVVGARIPVETHVRLVKVTNLTADATIEQAVRPPSMKARALRGKP